MKKIAEYLKECSEFESIEFPDFSVIPGSSNVMFSAPHSYTHKRKNRLKPRDVGTNTIVKMIKSLTNAHIIYTNKKLNYDPNYDKNNKYQQCLSKYIKENNIKYLIDIHGSKKIKNFDIEIGTNNLKNINNDKELLNEIKLIMKKYGMNHVRVDKIYKSSNNTICNQINTKTKITTLQFEISSKYRVIKNNSKNYKAIINTLIDIATYLERRENMNEIDYQTKYDEVLDIKPSYGYKRELKPVEYDEVGLEIEVAVNYERNSYSFIRKMLMQIKDLVGDNGYFVKDGTINADYSFEIVLDPMKVEQIYTIYDNLMNIIDFSNGMIEISKQKNCGIHMNFNKNDVTDLNEAHRKITSYVCESSNAFEENMYKQFRFIWDYEEYCKYQQEVSAKYVWVNYLKSKIIEIRNIKTGMSAKKLVNTIEEILSCLYGDKRVNSYESKLYSDLEKLYNKSFSKKDKIIKQLKEKGIVVIKIDDNDLKMLTLPDDILEKIEK